MATCKTCGETSDLLFYKSIVTYCKEHWKEKVRSNRKANIEHYRMFDRIRASLPHRVDARAAYQQTEQGKKSHLMACKEWAKRYPKRKAAQGIVGKAIFRGKMQKLPCFICGNEVVEAHHADYDRPLSVTWLCVNHHKEIHWNKTV